MRRLFVRLRLLTMVAAAVVMVVSHPVNMSLRRYAKKERGRGEREGGKMAAEIKFLRSLEKMPSAAPTDPRSLAEVH